MHQKGVEKKNHNVYIRHAGAYTKNRWAQRNGFLKSHWG